MEGKPHLVEINRELIVPYMNIGFFDSGVGGLFVLRHVVEELPEYHYVFLGDTVNVPYGDKTDEEIYALVKACLTSLFEHDCSLVVFACNTASVSALRRLQDEFVPHHFPDRKVLGVIIPTVEEILSQETKSVAIIATARTIRSEKYIREIEKLRQGVKITQLETPTLVPLIEAGKLDEAGREAIALIQKNILPQAPDTLILGCTHYGLLKEMLREAFPKLRILAQEEIIPRKLRDYLRRHLEIEKNLVRDGKREFYLTKITPVYETLIQEWLGEHSFNLHTFSSCKKESSH